MTPREQAFFGDGGITAFIAGTADQAKKTGLAVVASLIAAGNPAPSLAAVGAHAIAAQTGASIAADRNHAEVGTSCFVGHLDNPLAAEAAKATVKIVSVDPKGHATDIGSGAVIRDSGNSKNPDNRVLTNTHVGRMMQAHPENTTQIVGPTGALLATVTVGAMNKLDTASFGDNSDTASLQTIKSSREYRQMTGVPLAPVLSPGILTGLVSDPVNGAPTHGISGGLAMTSAGLVGVVSGAISSQQTVSIANPHYTDSNIMAAALATPTLPATSRVFITTPDDTVLKSLNAAGQNIQRAVQPPSDTVLVGFPRSLCMGFATQTATADPANARDYDLVSRAGTPPPKASELAGWTNPAEANKRFATLMDKAAQTVSDPGTQSALRDVRDLTQKKGLGELVKMGLANNGIGDPVSAVSDLIHRAAGQTSDSGVREDLLKTENLVPWLALKDARVMPSKASGQSAPADTKRVVTPRSNS